MTPIADYLKKLLYQYDCVVVPDLGGFLTHHQPARFELASSTGSSSTEVAYSGVGRFMPPRKRLAFNEALRLDDGILTNYVMLHESLTRDAAQQRIGQFVAEVRDRIQRTGSHTLDGIGMLTVNGEGRFQFEPQLRQNFLGDAYGLPVIEAMSGVSTLPVRAAASSAVETAPAVIGLVNVEVEEPEVEEVFAHEDTGIRPLLTRGAIWRWAAAVALVGSLGTVGYLFGTDAGRFQQGSLSPANLLQIPASLSDSYQAMVAGWNRPATPVTAPTKIIQVVTATPVTATPAPAPLTVRAVSTIESAPGVPVAAAKQPTKSASATASSVAEPTRIAMATKRTAVVTKLAERKKVSTALHYVIVAGSFANRTNALHLRRTLRKAGYTDAYIIPPMEKGTLHKVAAFGTYDPAEIPAAAEKIGTLTGTPGWVFSHR